MNILYVAFEFAPLNRGGVYRSTGFAKWLNQFGINPILVTLDESSYKDVYGEYSTDAGIGKMIPENTVVIKVKTEKAQQKTGIRKFMSIYFSIHGNETKYWSKNFYAAVDEAIQKYKPAAIMATVPPFSVLPLAKTISEKYHLPLVLDFRDAWSQWKTVPYGSVFHYRRTVALEKKYLSAAAAVITTSQQTLDAFKHIHPDIPAQKFHCIMNGYEGGLTEWKPLNISHDLFTIGYVGSFYFNPTARAQMLKPWWKKRGHRMLQYIPHRQDWLYRSPYFFFKAIAALNKTFPAVGQKIKIKFAGKKQEWLPDMISSFGLDNQVELTGELAHEDSIKFQQQCDALLLTSAKQLNGKADYSIAGKTFEYFQAQRPVIGFVCNGAQKDLLSRSGTAVICDPDNIKDAVSTLNYFFNGTIRPVPDLNFLQTLSREKLTQQLAELIKETVQQHG